MTFAVILNPQAGRGLAAREWPRLAAELQRRSLSYQLYTTFSGAEALQVALTLPPQQPLMTVGGEGTVAALLPALVGTGRPLAVIALGSGNDFAGFMRLAPGDFGEALSRLRHAPRQVDALRAELPDGTVRLLLNGLGTGFDAQVNEEMTQAPAAWSGFWRYAYGALRALRQPNSAWVSVTLDGQLLCAVMNGSRVGGGFLPSPASDARDGLLNVVVGGDLQGLRLLRLVPKVLRGTHLGEPRVYAATGRSVQVKWHTPVPAHLDGDVIGKVTALQVSILPGAVTLLNG